MDHLTLRPVEDADLPIFFAHQADRESYEMAVFPPRELDAFMAHWARIRADPANWTLAITVDGRVVGNMLCWEHDSVREVAYWIGREFWGRGYASRALAAFLALEPARPLRATVAKTNVGSRRVLEKSGFVVFEEAGDELHLRLDESAALR